MSKRHISNEGERLWKQKQAKKNTMAIIFIMVAMATLLGCSEMDVDFGSEENIVTDCVGVSQIENPKKVTIYEVKPWRNTIEEIQNVFLTAQITETIEVEASEEVTYYAEHGEFIEDLLVRGMKSTDQNIGVSIGFTIRDRERMMLVYKNENFERLIGTFMTTLHLPDELEETEEYKAALGHVENYMDELGYPNYEVRDAIKVDSDRGEPEFYLMFLEQVVDDIPFSLVEIPDNVGLMYHNVYNGGFNRNIKQYDNTVLVCASSEEILYWWTLGNGTAAIIQKEVRQCEIVSASRAYKEVLRFYEKRGGGNSPSLELAELQYKYIEKEGRQILWPVWVFGVTEEEHGELPELYTPGKKWNYYVVDAMTGMFFTDIEL